MSNAVEVVKNDVLDFVQPGVDLGKFVLITAEVLYMLFDCVAKFCSGGYNVPGLLSNGW